MVAFRSRKSVFWEALVMTLFIFLGGFFLGLMSELNRASEVGDIYLASEISLVDSLATSFLLKNDYLSCEQIKKRNIEFADRVYREAKILERYEESNTLTDSMEILRRKFDLLRTMIWLSNEGPLKRCKNYHMLVYLYSANTEDIELRARQNVWSRVLFDLKLEFPEIILLPIAADQNITSTEYLLDFYGVKKIPAIVIDNRHVIYEVRSKDSLKGYFKKNVSALGVF